MPANRPERAQAEQNCQLFVIWKSFQRRPETLASYFGIKVEYVTSAYSSKILKGLDYLVKSAKTIRLLHRNRPDVVWIQSPPTFIPHLVLAWRRVMAPSMVVILDCHNAVIRAPWSRVPFLGWALRSADLSLAHNADVVGPLQALGAPGDRVMVLEDRSAGLSEGPAVKAERVEGEPPLVLVPCSFAKDEPIAQLLEAACRTPGVRYVITGNPKRAHEDLVAKAPANVEFPGFISKRDFDALLHSCDLLIGLTTLEGVQLSAANEGVAAGKPMVLSHTQTLRSLFAGASVFVDPLDAASIANGVEDALSRWAHLKSCMRELRLRRDERWLKQAKEVNAFIARAKQVRKSPGKPASHVLPARVKQGD
jgi:glycosyltransferase involved in cell wall biosynthesis